MRTFEVDNKEKNTIKIRGCCNLKQKDPFSYNLKLIWTNHVGYNVLK